MRYTFITLFGIVSCTVVLIANKAAPNYTLKLPAFAKYADELCSLSSIPPELQSRLKDEFSAWKVQDPEDLSPLARQRWEAEKPLACPGLAVGQFETATERSYAVLLVHRDHAGSGYAFLIFSRAAVPRSYAMRTADVRGRGAANSFIHTVRISRFFDESSKRKFQVQAADGILFVDAAPNEYATDVYFWSNGNYKHQPVDY